MALSILSISNMLNTSEECNRFESLGHTSLSTTLEEEASLAETLISMSSLHSPDSSRSATSEFGLWDSPDTSRLMFWTEPSTPKVSSNHYPPMHNTVT
jgi:hypothetical protein